ncbi:MAG: L,D-transpeptidase family protein, partial [Candidatus Colwellbacteria bacterium]|nr:L,D-transpeptidase family protein [Candidatus Colwellbacteria bacterium]
LVYGARPAFSDRNFFNESRRTLAEQKADFIEADLSMMKLTLYEKGEAMLTVDILGKGKPGSWWETPAGLYKVELKEKAHFSTIGRVYQPWSMQFQGNFFIHGWPYYPDGTPTSREYTGGCIKLSTEDAKVLYDRARVGMPVLVFEDDFAGDASEYAVRTPEIDAESFLVADLQNNFVFLSQNPEQTLRVEGARKLLTALVTAEYVNLERAMVVPRDALVPTPTPRLAAGERRSVFELLYLLLFESSDEAEQTLFDDRGGRWYARVTREKIRSIGMDASSLDETSGELVSTARDLWSLLRYLYHNRHFIIAVTNGGAYESAYGTMKIGELVQHNIFADPRIAGGMRARSGDGENVVAVGRATLRDAERPIAFILIGAARADEDLTAVLDWIQNSFTVAYDDASAEAAGR